MRGKVARLIRHEVYGEELSPRARKYRMVVRKKDNKKLFGIADQERQLYKRAKRLHHIWRETICSKGHANRSNAAFVSQLRSYLKNLRQEARA